MSFIGRRVNQITKAIKAVQEEYQEDNSAYAALTWEMIKLKIREHSMIYANSKQTSKHAKDRRTIREE